MLEPPSKAALEDLLTFLLPHSVHTSQNALMEALSQWLNRHYPVTTALALRTQAIVDYEAWVGQTITAGQYQRRMLPPDTPLPYLDADMNVVQSFAHKALAYLHGLPVEVGVHFLATLNGAWILSCPEVIIRNAPEFATSITTATTEADLSFLMVRQLSLYLH